MIEELSQKIDNMPNEIFNFEKNQQEGSGQSNQQGTSTQQK
ncbi:hypothetical protein [Mycoplasma suis]|nr:hypothetical protein [Mycoplasma suis]